MTGEMIVSPVIFTVRMKYDRRDVRIFAYV